MSTLPLLLAVSEPATLDSMLCKVPSLPRNPAVGVGARSAPAAHHVLRSGAPDGLSLGAKDPLAPSWQGH